MKNFIKAALALVVVFAFGCGNQNSAENSVKQFFTLIKNKDYVKAKEFGTKQSGETVDKIESTAKGSSFDPKSLMDPKEVTCKEDSSAKKKKCEVCCDGKGNKKTVTVIEENGKWLVDMNKNELKNANDLMNSNPIDDANKMLKEGAEKMGELGDSVNKKLDDATKGDKKGDKKDEKKK